MNVLELSEQEIIRRNSMNELRAMGIEPYPAAEYVTNAFSTDIKKEFKDDAEPRHVSVAGRIMSRRVMGKASFIELQDSKGRIQVYITRDDICPGEDKEMYNTVFKRLLDLGDGGEQSDQPFAEVFEEGFALEPAEDARADARDDIDRHRDVEDVVRKGEVAEGGYVVRLQENGDDCDDHDGDHPSREPFERF